MQEIKSAIPEQPLLQFLLGDLNAINIFQENSYLSIIKLRKYMTG